MYGSEQHVPSAVLLLNSLSLPSTQDGSALKVPDALLCLTQTMQSFLAISAEGNWTSWQIPSPRTSFNGLAVSRLYQLFAKPTHTVVL